MPLNGTRFTFTAGTATRDTFAVVSFHLSQCYSELFTLNVVLVSSDPAVGVDKVLDEMATLTIWQGDEIKRRVRGIVTFYEQGDTGKHQTQYRLTIRPYFWRSSQRQNCRSFQNLNIVAILDPLLREMGVLKHDTLFRSSHNWREFCVQFMESDYDFISRLLAEEGIFFYEEEFLKANDQKLTFADNCSALISIGAFAYNPNAASEAATYCINNFRRTAQVRPSRVITQDYTFTAPNWQAQYQEKASNMVHQHTVYDVFDYPGRFKDEQHGADFAKYQMEGWRNNADVVIGSTNSPQFYPGVRFALTDHPREDLNANWQVVAIEMHGDQPQARIGQEGQGTTLNTEFEVIPSTQTWRPTPKPKPRIDGPQIAIVTGPPGEEIFCDEHGRVRVKFAWDRYNKADNYSSCWIRVSQAWAGTGFGNIAIPRVGQEVIVDFLNGDPDQPIITGRTYHASNRSPGSLPGTKTQMAIRSQTYKGNGYNELMFEDATRQELLSMHAQKDMRVTILHDLTASIKNDEKRRIDGKRTTHVVKDEHVYVEGEKRDHFVKDYSLSLDQQFHLKVGDAMLAEAGKEFHFKSGSKIVLESGCEITLKAGSTFIKLDPSGVTLSPMLNVGAGIPGRGSGWAGQFPDQLTGNHDASPASAPPPFSPLIMSDNQRQSLQNEEPFCEECEKCKQQGGCSI